MFTYFQNDAEYTYCPVCGRKIMLTPVQHDDQSIALDGLPTGRENNFLIESFHYCPECGAVWTVCGTPLNLCHKAGQIATHKTKEEILFDVYNKYAIDDRRDYVLGVLAECNGDIAKRDECWAKYLKHIESGNADEEFVDLLFCADIARQLGLFDKAKTLLKMYQLDDWDDPEVVSAFRNAIIKAIDQRNTKRLELPMIFAYSRD